MAALTTQLVVDAGTKPTFGAASVSDTAEVGNGINTFAVYKNSDTNIKTLTITSPLTTDAGDTYPSHTVTIAANTGEVWVPLRKSYKNDAVAGVGRCTLAISGTGNATGVTVAIVQTG